jgi:alanyl-tRNA synthetase
LGALAFFGEKYGEKVNVYFIGKKGERTQAFSKEFCGGPHVANTKNIGHVTIIKEESAGSGIRRIYATIH